MTDKLTRRRCWSWWLNCRGGALYASWRSQCGPRVSQRPASCVRWSPDETYHCSSTMTASKHKHSYSSVKCYSIQEWSNTYFYLPPITFFGHLLCSDHALYEPTHGKTQRGRPRTNYITYIQKITGHQLSELNELAQNREDWCQLVVECADPQPPD